MKYFIIASGLNCKLLAMKCYKSLVKLNFSGQWSAIMISDGSVDGTKEFFQSIIGNNQIKRVHYPVNMGAAYRRHQAIKEANLNEEDVIIFLGLDDELLPNSLTRIDNEYKVGKWVTYGNWINQKGLGLPEGFKLEFDQITHKNRDYRKVVYRSTAPNTFKYFLYKQIPESDLMIEGTWINSTTESEVMFSCLEMAGQQRIGVIKDKIYLYNQNLPNGSLIRLGKEHKYRLYNIIINRPKKPLFKRYSELV